jgi:hypothetical protein
MTKDTGRFIIGLLAVTFVFCFVTGNIVPFGRYSTVEFSDNAYIFYDKFDAPILHFEWAWGGDFGEGSVVLSRDENYTFIEFHVMGKEYTRANFLRRFPPATHARIEVTLQFVQLADDSEGLLMFRTDGGWFGVIRPEPELQAKFLYMDDLGRWPPALIVGPVDNQWHRVVIEHVNETRRIYFDGELIEVLQGPSEFSHLIIGTRDHVTNYGGVFRISSVRVELYESVLG